MSVVVHDDMPIDLALRLLWREATREGIISTVKANRYFVSKNHQKHQVKRAKKKTKSRRRRYKRRFRNKNL